MLRQEMAEGGGQQAAFQRLDLDIDRPRRICEQTRLAISANSADGRSGTASGVTARWQPDGELMAL